MISVYINDGGVCVFEQKHTLDRKDKINFNREDLENIVLVINDEHINLKELLEIYHARPQSSPSV